MQSNINRTTALLKQMIKNFYKFYSCAYRNDFIQSKQSIRKVNRISFFIDLKRKKEMNNF